jgi:hypothetical protein
MVITSAAVPGKVINRGNNYAIINLTYEAIAKLLELPEGSRIVGIQDMFATNSVAFKVIGLSIHQKVEGAEIPEIIPGQGGWTV